MTAHTRRAVMIGAGGLAACWGADAAAAVSIAGDRVAEDLDRYVGFGSKASGGVGDQAAGTWLDGELKAAGFRTSRVAFDAPFFDAARSDVVVGDVRIDVSPQAIVVPTPMAGLTGVVRRVAPGVPSGALKGAIALVDLPHGRWSSVLQKPIRMTIADALRQGAVAAIVVTNGPTGKAIALNADGRRPMFDAPVAIVAPDRAGPLLAAAAQEGSATLTVLGTSGRRPTFNIVGLLERGRPRKIIVSTPRSGWTSCAGERGGGIAAWCALGRWAPGALADFDLVFLCNSGHEYEYLGAERSIESGLPKPAETALWLHLGANVASRDWQELTGALLPLPSADAQRYLATSPDLLEPARRFFRGQPGLEVARSTADGAAGELTNVLAAGYAHVAGIFGAHRFHHVAGDDARCLDVEATRRVVRGLKDLMLDLARR